MFLTKCGRIILQASEEVWITLTPVFELANMGTCCSYVCRCTRHSSKDIVLLMVGLDNAGKTTAVKGLAGEATDNMIPSVGFSCTTLHYKGHSVKIYDLGGNKSIRGIWNKYFTDVHGVIFVVDASAVDRFGECSEELERLLQHEKLAGKPVLLLANKQDLPGAMDELDLVEELGIEDLVNRQKCPTSIETCAAVLSPDPAIQNGYKWLLETILRDFATLDARVSADTKAQKLQEQKLLEERLRRVEKLRETRRNMSNGHTLEDANEEHELNKNPFRPISELTAEDRATPGTKMILVQQSPPKQAVEDEKETCSGHTTNPDGLKSAESLSFASPTGSINELVKHDASADKNKKHGIFSRKNKTAPLPESSPVRKPALPPLKQAPIATISEPVPWMKPVLSASGDSLSDRRGSTGLDRAWGLEEALETVHPNNKVETATMKLGPQIKATSTQVTELSTQNINGNF
ncbi:hypothetical protein B566_EDAN003691 [Ephemera danica]|nr:hypothetical protein B566_EDAN003691 [Ephemera danica]